ncbi:MAG TPA: pro-sigmaK processing inhibitor BofA family protein [Oscillospiraceae bacterium]|nr:pro-sigmaK processing inhibitor BofA family protein [Oscillospiraceae bacterium]
MLMSEIPMYLYIFLSFLFVLALIFAKKSGHFIKSLITSAIGGLGALCAVGVIGQFVTLSIGVNFLTVAIAFSLSVPGVIMLLLVSILLT